MWIFAYMSIMVIAFIGGHWFLGSLMLVIGTGLYFDMKGYDNGP